MNLYNWLVRTMLIERLLGVGVYAGLLFVMYLCVRSAKDYKTLRKVLNVYIVLLCIMAFFYIPAESADLYRWRMIFQEYGWVEMSISEFADTYLRRVSTPVAYLVIYLCGRTGIDGLLPALCTLIFYKNLFYILKDLYRRQRASARSISLALLFSMASGSFLEVISGVRCFTALSILGRCFYDEIYNNKAFLKNIIWEVAAALMHSMAVVLLAGRILFLLIQKSKRTVTKLINVGVAAVAGIVAVYYGSDYIAAALSKAEAYFFADSTYTYSWEYLIGVMMIVQFLVIIKSARRTALRKPEQENLGNMLRFNTLIVATEVIVAFEYNMFHRLIAFSALTMVPLVAQAADDQMNRRLTRTISLTSIAILFLACARGNLSGYKFFLLR